MAILGVALDGPVSEVSPVSLRSVAGRLDGDTSRWEGGLAIRWNTCGEGWVWVPCYSDDEKVIGSGTDASYGVPLTYWAGYSCQSSSGTDFQKLARQQLELVQDALFEREFWRGDKTQAAGLDVGGDAAVPNDFLARDPVVLGGGTAVSPSRALGLLQTALGDCHVGVGMIHATRATVNAMVEKTVVKVDLDFVARDLFGNYVVGGAGYDGSPPIAVDAGQAPGTWAYATGMVYGLVGDVAIVPDTIAEATNRVTNLVEVLAEREALFMWSPCCTFAVNVSLT